MNQESNNSDVVAALVSNHRRFLDFLRRRTRSVDDVEELLQAAFVKAVEKSHGLRREESAVAWFYRLLRNALTDYYRRRDTLRRDADTVVEEVETPDDEALRRTVCACVSELIPTLKPDYAELLQRVDLDGQNVPTAAAALGITANNAGVRLHRARVALKARLEQSCGTCAIHGCLDCTCRDCE